jgi:hypothetical protein
MLAQFVEVAIGCPHVEPTVTIRPSLNVRDLIHPGFHELATGGFDIVHAEPGDRAGVEMVMFHRIGAEELETVPVLGDYRH